MQWWVSAEAAKKMGCTHYARLHGLIPGFCTVDDIPMWVSRSDLLNPIEDAISALWIATQRFLGIEESWSFSVGREIE